MRARRADPASVLARRYGVLLRCYPAAYRRRWGDEVLGVLLDQARPGQRWPTPRVAADLVACGLRRWASDDAVPGLDAGLRAAAPAAFALAVGLSMFLLVSGGLSAPGGTLAPLAYGCWLAAGAGAVTLPATARRDLLAAATAASVLVLPAAAALGMGRPPLWAAAVLASYGLIALAGHATAATVATRRRTVAAAASVGVLPSLAFLALGAAGHASAYYGAGLLLAGATTATVLVTVATRTGRAGRARPTRTAHAGRARPTRTGRAGQARHWAWLLLAQPATCLVAVRTTWSGQPDVAWPPIGRLAQFLLAGTAAVGAVVWLAHRGSSRPAADPDRVDSDRVDSDRVDSDRVGLDRAGTDRARPDRAGLGPRRSRSGSRGGLGAAAAGTGVALAAYLLVAGTLVEHWETLALLLAVVAFEPPVRAWRWIPVSAGATALAVAVVAGYAVNWHLGGWRSWFGASDLVATLALVPLVAGLMWGLAAAAPRRATLRPALLAGYCAAGAGYLLVPSVPLVAAGLAALTAAAVTTTRARHRRRAGDHPAVTWPRRP